jgi:alpha-glucosidase
MSFNFPPLFAPWTAEAWREQLEKSFGMLDPIGAWPTWVLSNHDQKRHRTRYGSEARARAAAVLLLTLRGTPFLYMGEELGLEDARVPTECQVDPGGRDGCRAPIPWTAAPGHGWGSEPWLPWPPEPERHNVESLRGDSSSILQLYRDVLHHRRESPALVLGDLSLLSAPEGVLVYRRRRELVHGLRHERDERTVALNFTGERQRLDLDALRVEIASDRAGEGEPFDGWLEPDQALILAPLP